ncbi:MAG: response regulator transcription factor [Gemmatimonadales bacterium]|jgi:RNA polymerase sigma factor (sigma-70 family)
MTELKPTVFIVDDDPGVLDSLKFLMRSVGLTAETYQSARDFLQAFDLDRPGCLILDVRMPEMSGMELQERLKSMESILPIIFITAHGDIPMAVQAVKAGAVDFIQKPFRDQDLIDKVQAALQQDAEMRQQLAERADISERIESLTPRELEVMELVVEGKPNKAIAHSLGISQRTVEIHRARVMEKMQAESVPQLVQMVIASGRKATEP